MHIQDLILLVIESESEKSLRGRATLQKKLYFLSALKKDYNLGFGPHYYGPYSSSVAYNLDLLVSCRFLREITDSYSRDESVLGELRRQIYSLTPDGEVVMGEIEKEDGYSDWKKALDTLNKQALANDFNTLSIAAKTHYIVNRDGTATRTQIRDTAEGYSWNISESQIENVFSFLAGLSLISAEKTT